MKKEEKRKARTREEIEQVVADKGATNFLLLEVLLDIREALTK